MSDHPSFQKDSSIRKLDGATYGATYGANLTQGFCVGSVPNGGFVASIFIKVASAYLAPNSQPDTIAAQWQFLNKTEKGPAVLKVEESKIGRGMSVLHITLYQESLLKHHPWISPQSKKKVVAYITNSSLDAEKGVTLPTGFEISHPPPVVDLERLADDGDTYWTRMFMPLMMVVPMLGNIEFYYQRAGHALPTTIDLWIRTANGEGFTNAALGYVSDVGPPLLVEAFRPEGPDSVIPEGGFAFNKIFWYPTVTMSLEVKKKLPDAGEEWLRLRVVAKMIQNGRYDAEVIIFDKTGDMVALSNHVALAVDQERNTSRLRKL